MQYRRYALVVLCMFMSLAVYNQATLEVEGVLSIKNSQGASPVPGTIRWTGTDFQGWNGTKWVSLLIGIAYEGEVTDIDGNKYPTIKIENREWMTENLRTTRYRDGTAIPQVTDNTAWGNANFGSWCWYNNDNSYEQPYGKLYNWYAVNNGKGLCPTGWHVPTDSEWTTLTTFLGGLGLAGGPMKESRTAHWISPNTGATNASGFTGLPGGLRSTSGSFFSIGNVGYWWSSTESSSSDAWYRVLYYNNGLVNRVNDDKRLGFSVRCVR